MSVLDISQIRPEVMFSSRLQQKRIGEEGGRKVWFEESASLRPRRSFKKKKLKALNIMLKLGLEVGVNS